MLTRPEYLRRLELNKSLQESTLRLKSRTGGKRFIPASALLAQKLIYKGREQRSCLTNRCLVMRISLKTPCNWDGIDEILIDRYPFVVGRDYLNDCELKFVFVS